MADALLEKLRTQRTTLPFKNGEFAKTFFDLVDEDEINYPLLHDNVDNKKCYGYSYKIDVGFFTKIFVFKADKYNEEIKIDVSIFVVHLVVDNLKARYNAIDYVEDQLIHYAVLVQFLL